MQFVKSAWNAVIVLIFLAYVLYAWLGWRPGEKGAPVSASVVSCSHIADQFRGGELTVNDTNLRIRSIEGFREVRRDRNTAVCTATVSFDGASPRMMELSALATGQGMYFEIRTARPENINCDELAQEVLTSLKEEEVGDVGRPLRIRNGFEKSRQDGLECSGFATFSHSRTDLPVVYSFDGELFSIALE